MIPVPTNIDLHTVSTKQSFTSNEDNSFLGTIAMWRYYCTAMDFVCSYTVVYVPIMSNLINISLRLKAYCILRSFVLRDHRCKSLMNRFCFCHRDVQLIWCALYPGVEFQRACSKPMATNKAIKGKILYNVTMM